MNTHQRIELSVVFAMFSLTSCGVVVPEIHEAWQDKDAGRNMERGIKEQVYCEIRRAVIKAANDKTAMQHGKLVSLLPDAWGVQITLSIEVDETTAINPGASLITPMHAGVTNFGGEYIAGSSSPLSTVTYPFLSSPQQYSLGLGGTASSQGFRTDKFSFYWDLDKLKTKEKDDCSPQRPNGILLESDLNIEEWLWEALVTDRVRPSSELTGDADKGFNQDILSYEVKFIVITSGNITPTWKLVRVATNNGNLPLASVNRTRTHDLTITFGPSNKPTGKGKPSAAPSEPSLMAANAHLASQIGLAVANSVRVTTP